MDEAIQAASERVKAIAPLIDENGRKLIIDSLTNVNADPWQSMAILQRRFSHNLPTTESATQLLIAMESDNASISVSLFESLSSHLESMVGKLSQVALEDLLHETIKYIRIKELKSIPVSIMKKMNIIPAKYLQALISGSTLTVCGLSCNSAESLLTLIVLFYRNFPLMFVAKLGRQKRANLIL